MSYEIHIRPDSAGGDASLPASKVETALLALDGVEGGEGSFRIDDAEAGIWIEIDAGLVDGEGDLVDDAAGRANRVWLNLPASSFERSQDRALALARELAEPLGWEAFDPQTGRVIHVATTRLDEPQGEAGDGRSWDPFRRPRVSSVRRPLRDALVVGVGLLLIYLLIR